MYMHTYVKFLTRKSVCKVCGMQLSGNHSTNLKRHLHVKHGEIIREFDTEEENKSKVIKKKKITYETSEESILNSIIKIVTTDGKPFMFLDSEGFKEIVDPIYNALGMNPITSRNIMSLVVEREESIKNDIRALVQGKLLSLKIDVATRMDKAILGVNLQMIMSNISKTEIIVKTLGMIQLTYTHTGDYIKEKILEIIEEYGITVDQIFSVTSDNGRNMVKTVKILNDDMEEPFFEDDTEAENWMGKLDEVSLANIHLVRCAAHTLQLCVYDVNKLNKISQQIDICRKLCKTLRTETMSRILIEHNKNIPSLDVVTSWNSTYLMLKQLIELKEFLATKCCINTDIEWDWVETYVEAFKDAYDATIKLQEKHLVYSEFFIIWTELKLQCQNSKNFLKQKLLAQIELRESKLLENTALLSAIYMDPRVNRSLTDYQKYLATQNLKKIAFRLFELKHERRSIKSPSSAYLDDVETVPESIEEPISDKLVKIYFEVDNFDKMYSRLPLNADILQFFSDVKLKSPQLSDLAHVVLATPATQVSVERAFSALHYILSERQSSISSHNLNSLLFVKLNSE
ncbi:uncharacterized protein Dmoj_GI12344, isoform A [Drosophila mojavensis]|uniref:Uncharacterized protein, isoform A n=1 Tax=Drosophila mojavensis TaxID=7230 RepID=B4KZY8_DROMO|nr:uncharacterized protein Dmoj_GI12344, isoform A [Drosophila mojavensis]